MNRISGAAALLCSLGALPASAGPIIAPLEGHIRLAELRHLIDTAGPLVWTTDGDMVIAQYWDEEPGIAATVEHPGYVLELSETAASTTAVLRSVVGMDCGRWQFDFERYPLDQATLKSLVVDTGVMCGPGDDLPREFPTPTPFGVKPVPEPATFGLVALGLLACARRRVV